MVKYGYAGSVDEMIERLEYDILYYENMSLILDITILIYTVKQCLQVKVFKMANEGLSINSCCGGKSASRRSISSLLSVLSWDFVRQPPP